MPANQPSTNFPEFTREDLENMTEEQLAELDALLFQEPWMPLPGPQMDAWNSDADVVGYGGAAGGGKTDLACGLASCRHSKTLILRREGTQLTGIIDRLEKIIGDTKGFNSQTKVWKVEFHGKRRFIQMGGLANPDDHKKYQGQDHDLKIVDEATECRESDVRFIMGWNRSADPTITSQVLLTFNPPTTAEGRWIIRYFAPWLDPKHPRPAKPGELRWFTTHPVTGEDIECDGPTPMTFKDDDGNDILNEQGEIDVCMPRSRTFIPARVEDNPYYMETGYKSVLQSMPEPLRSQMLKGDFMAGVEDDPWQVIPTAWIQAAMDRWKPLDEYFPKGEPRIMDSMGVDIARGGIDKTIIMPRYGTWFGPAIKHPGAITKTGAITAGLVIAERRNKAVVHIDPIGVGSSPYDYLKENNVQVVGVNNAEKGIGLTKDGKLKFVNRRAELYWRMREALDPSNPVQIALPPDEKLLADLAVVTWELRTNGILIQPKEWFKKELGRSPDDADACVLANVNTIKVDLHPKNRAKTHTTAHEYDPYADDRERLGVVDPDYDPYK